MKRLEEIVTKINNITCSRSRATSTITWMSIMNVFKVNTKIFHYYGMRCNWILWPESLHLIIFAVFSTKSRSVNYSDWSTRVTSPKSLSRYTITATTVDQVLQHLVKSWLSCAQLWQLALFQELFPLAGAVQHLGNTLLCLYSSQSMKGLAWNLIGHLCYVFLYFRAG